MALSDDQQATLRRLRRRLDNDLKDRRVNGHRIPGFLSLHAYRRGQQRLRQLGIAVPEALREFVTIVNWPGTYVDALVTRLRLQGFMLDGEVEADLWKTWQANSLDTEFRMGLDDMVTFGRGYLCAGTPDAAEAPALLTIESPLQMIHEWSNRERRVTAAARFYTDDNGPKKIHRATLYEPNETTWLIQGKGGKWELDGDPDEHGGDRVMVHPMVNRADTDDRYGESEMLGIITLTDACARALTNAQVATELMSIPQRWAAGMSDADFTDAATGEQLTQWEAYFGAIWSTESTAAKFGQFSAADLTNFKAIVGLYAQLCAGSTGLPMRYFGQLADNPPSADGIRADEARLVGTAEDKQLFAEDAVERAMRDARFIETGVDDAKLLELESRWRDAATPTRAQAADATVKLRQQGIITLRQARVDMGYTPREIARMEEEDTAAQVDPVLAAILKTDANVGGNAGA